MVIWLVGLSGSGKTTIGRQVAERWKRTAANTVLVDGDEVRRIFRQDGTPADYSVAGRRINGERIYELCEWLDLQGINVVCCVLSIFEDLRARARANYSAYFEVFLDASLETVVLRDVKGLYRAAQAGEMPHVVGLDIEFTRPEHPDLVLDSSGDGPTAAQLATAVIEGAGIPIGASDD